MILENIGYKNKEQVIELINNNIDFNIYDTSRGTQILIFGKYKCSGTIYYPKKDRLPWKITEGKKINRCLKISFSSFENSIEELDTKKWNNGNQIICYQEYFDSW